MYSITPPCIALIVYHLGVQSYGRGALAINAYCDQVLVWVPAPSLEGGTQTRLIKCNVGERCTHKVPTTPKITKHILS